MISSSTRMQESRSTALFLPLRIVYRWEVDRLLVLVLAIGQRGEVYRDLKG